ncbi:MAG: alpha/beta hydrolase [Aromatoleum sp.]|jgi:pimeloyl-ACP methyl ester carboxylesterase|uniref:alpha/beta fold hydrolase n=1 Tax=Aromatoleum sp. TaxID=2307007 RepID=UPI002893AC70|nr:alpha/beta hydrolase [Aromatoleum sp.]MDT3670222.1 alpha/beta hydrolase [Aromatoleum sp.]
MTDLNTPTIRTRESWVEHPQGRIHARSWAPSNMRSGVAPIVLFHDSLGCVELWRDFPADLSAATGRRVVAYDRLGFGKSDPRSARPPLDFIADEAETYFPAVREQLGIGPFIAFGHSVGGAMAIHCAAEFAADCKAPITESAQVFPEELTLRSIAEAREQFRDEAQIARLAKYHGGKAAWVLDAWTENWLDPGFASWSLDTVLPRVTCPVLAIHGDEDEYGSTCHAEIIATLSKGRSQVEILPDTRHVPHRERPAVVLELMSRFAGSLD